MMKARVHIVALGDVGATLATGLVLLGGDCISAVGVFDVREALADRCAFELNQILLPFDVDALPPVEKVREDELFACNVFVFCASVGVPPVGADIADVRMAQLEGNAGILARYARMAEESGFCGQFAVVSDPVDLLCQCALYESSRGGARRGLLPEQIRGYGLGVMHARAVYYARREPRLSGYIAEGRAFGPHGEGLVLANSLTRYDDALSRELTGLVTQANREMRRMGFKPYIAPALSSGALSLLSVMRGQWHYSAVYDGGVFWGCKNRQTPQGIEVDHPDLPAPLLERVLTTRQRLLDEGARWRTP